MSNPQGESMKFVKEPFKMGYVKICLHEGLIIRLHVIVCCSVKSAYFVIYFCCCSLLVIIHA